jgi:hypothetical protein
VKRWTVLLAAWLLVPGMAIPGVAWAGAPEELTGLFIQGCLPFVGDPAALRAWAGQTGLPPVVEQARAAFLHGAPGQVFNGSVAGVKLALVSSDDGICSAVTDQATQQAVSDALEAGFRQAGLGFRLLIERDDAQVNTIHDREYVAVKDKRVWRILAATVKGDTGGEAMLTAGPK